jgi:hypothetical protein
MLFGLALASMAGAANAMPSVTVQQPAAAVQQADWYCGPNCQRHRYWEHRRWERERWREQSWRYRHSYPYAYRPNPYYYYR